MKGGNVFGFLIFVVLAVFLVWAWSAMSGEVASLTTTAISETSGSEHSGALEFVLRSFVWVVPLIIVLGLLLMGVRS